MNIVDWARERLTIRCILYVPLVNWRGETNPAEIYLDGDCVVIEIKKQRLETLMIRLSDFEPSPISECMYQFTHTDYPATGTVIIPLVGDEEMGDGV